MKAIIKIVLGAFAGIISIIAFIFAVAFVTGNFDLMWQEYFGVKQQNIETQIFKETEQYREAKQQELARLKYEYDQADSTGQDAIGATIRLRFADDDPDRFQEELGKFLIKIRGY